MKPPVILIALLATASLRVCESDDGKTNAPAAEAPAKGEAKAEIRAQMGGQLVAVGEHHVELRIFQSGAIEALVLDAKGALIAEPEKAKVLVKAKPEVALAWQPATARFSGKAEGELAAGPLEVELKLGEAAATGKLEGAVLLVGPELGGTLVVADRHGVELLIDTDGSVEALVHDSAGARVGGDAGLKLEAKVSGTGGKLHAIALAYSEAKARFTGKAEAGVKLEAGPAELAIGGNVVAKLPNLALRAEAKHGGRVVVAGDYSVELVAEPGGIVAAYVFDASGSAYAQGDLDLKLQLGGRAFVNLKWDAPSLSYRAKLEGNLSVEPIVVSLHAQGRAHVGAAAAAKLDAAAKADVAADAKLAAKAGAKANAKASVKAPSVKVSAPKVSVQKTGSTGAKAKAGFSFGTK